MLDVYYLENTNRNFNDMYLCYCGFEKCVPLHSFGPAIRPNFLLHYVLDGKGYYYVDDKKYTITKNQGFLINPNTVTFYQADKDDPWTYLWIGIDGLKVSHYLKAIGLDKENLIFKYNDPDILKDYLMDMLKNHKSSDSNAFKIDSSSIVIVVGRYDVTPCLATDLDIISIASSVPSIVSFPIFPCICISINPGDTNLPLTSITSHPFGTSSVISIIFLSNTKTLFSNTSFLNKIFPFIIAFIIIPPMHLMLFHIGTYHF